MKIALVSGNISRYNNKEDFYNIQFFGLAKELVKKGHTIDIYTASDNGFYERKIYTDKKKFFTVYYLPIILELFGQRILSNLIKKINSKEYNHIISAEDNQLITLLLSLNKKNKLIVFQGAYKYTKRIPFNVLWPLFDFVFGWIIRKNCCAVVAKTTSAKKFMARKKYKNIFVIPVGVDPSRFRRKDKEGFKIKLKINDEPVLLYVGILEKRRNIIGILESLDYLKKKLPNFKFLIIGEGPEEGEILRKIRKLNLEKNIIFIKETPNNKISEAYSASDIFILNSDYEIFGMVLVEGMACGTPCITTPTAGALDIIKDRYNGILTPFNNPEVLAKKILILLENKKLSKKISKNAIKTIQNGYTWNKIANQYESMVYLLKNEKN